MSCILVVEDEAILAQDIVRVLSRAAHEVAGIADSFESAIAHVDHARPDLVLMDIRLKGEGDGIEAAREIRRRHDVPVVYLAAYADKATLERVSATDPFGYVLKPFEDRELHAAVEIALFKHRIERELRTSEERHRSLVEDVFDTSNLGVVILDAERRVVWLNRPLEGFFGLAREELVGLDAHSLIDVIQSACADSSDLADALAGSYLRGNRIEAFECCVRPGEGRAERVLEHHGQPIRAGLYRGGWTGYFYDVTERHKVEVELQRAKRLAGLGALAGGIAHDFNNILTGIYSGISLALREIDEAHPAHKTLRDIDASKERASQVSKQLLTFAQGGVPVRERVSLSALVIEVGSCDLKDSNVRVVYEVEPGVWDVDADPGQVQQAVSNLFLNARQAMLSGGSISVELRNREVMPGQLPSLPGGRYVELAVRDGGEGIPAELFDSIFEPYFSTRRVGHGLGLAVVHSIVKRHGGRVEVESELGVGTVFRVLLPAVSQGEQRVAPVARDAAGSLPLVGRVLVMDDEALVRTLLVRMLERAGCQVDSVGDGREAVQAYAEARKEGSPYDVVIMDLVVEGGMGGDLAVRHLLAIDPDAEVIVASGYSSDPIMSRPQEYGFRSALQKPFSYAQLVGEVRRLLEDRD